MARAEAAKSQCDELEEKMKAVQKTARGKARNTMRLSAVLKMGQGRYLYANNAFEICVLANCHSCVCSCVLCLLN
jgi:hypothetical protein